jgi:hypothetical protein
VNTAEDAGNTEVIFLPCDLGDLGDLFQLANSHSLDQSTGLARATKVGDALIRADQ